MEAAYAPLIAELERRLLERGVHLRARKSASSGSYKRSLLRLAVSRFGAGFVEELGRELAGYTGHPFIRALLTAKTPEQLLARWARLEVLAHSENRLRLLAVGPRSVRALRYRVSGSAPTLEEDRLVLGLLGSLLRSIGAEGARARPAGPSGADASEGRVWELRWVSFRERRAASALGPWGASTGATQAAFALLLEDPGASLTAIARRIALSSRSFQRRLASEGTSFRFLRRAARIARAGEVILGVSARSSLTSVAHACGFADSAHFTREFRELVGTQPRRFVRSLRPE